jgi:hypothetical protein
MYKIWIMAFTTVVFLGRLLRKDCHYTATGSHKLRLGWHTYFRKDYFEVGTDSQALGIVEG